LHLLIANSQLNMVETQKCSIKQLVNFLYSFFVFCLKNI